MAELLDLVPVAEDVVVEAPLPPPGGDNPLGSDDGADLPRIPPFFLVAPFVVVTLSRASLECLERSYPF